MADGKRKWRKLRHLPERHPSGEQVAFWTAVYFCALALMIFILGA